MNRNPLKAAAASAALLCFACQTGSSHAEGAQRFDLLIVGGLVYGGDLAPARIADVGIVADKVTFVGDATKSGLRARKTLDAKGMMVAPGFIDAHTHTVDELASPDPAQRLVARQVMQGVTTSIIGVDGEGTPELKAQIDKFDSSGVGQNFAAYVGFGAIREKVLGEDARAPTAAELDTMKALAAKGMCEGALGLSSGLFYAPQSFASTEEVIAVAKEAGRRGGLYDTHQRDEGNSSIGVVASLQEAIRIGQESGATLHVAHIKVAGGSKPDGESMAELVRMIEAAQASGQKVTADQYPWSAANTGLVDAVIPRWAQDGGREVMLKRFENPADVARMKSESKITPGVAAAIMIDVAPNQPELVGKRLADIAHSWNVDPTEAAIRILKQDDASVAVFIMTEPDIRNAMTQPWVMTSSDGRSGGHPRAYASYPRLWTNYVVDQKVITPVQFVHRSTGLVADTLGLPGRGYIKPGYFADIVVIDPKAYQPKATFAEPKLLSTGVVDVVVNGKIELENGKATGVLAGRGIAKSPPAGTCP